MTHRDRILAQLADGQWKTRSRFQDGSIMTLEDALRDELDRVRILREDYDAMSIGMVDFWSLLLSGYLASGRIALRGGDDVAMQAALDDLRRCE